MAPQQPVSIAPATMAEAPAIRTVLAHSLSEDPMLTWMFPQRDALRLSRIAFFFSGQVERLVGHGLVHSAMVEGEIVGAALWIPEGTPRLDSLPRPRDIMGILLGETRNRDLIDEFTAARDGAPSVAGTYLATLGVLEEYRGHEVGTRLVEAGHRAITGPTWVETTSPRNLPFYRRLGYEVVHEAPFAGGTTTMTRLVRDTMAP
ncbi:GNAT family N-acetyltransferase [Brachybacterium sp. NPDC056505]|uniref:GNAT family N-acetyltransferase n=1 Tax=Brachybacterium sp. NPDC056505 TaxID=3345843 RepID=UPI00367287D2